LAELSDQKAKKMYLLSENMSHNNRLIICLSFILFQTLALTLKQWAFEVSC
jgi:hypothetical protein